MPLAPKSQEMKRTGAEKDNVSVDEILMFYKSFISKERPGLREFYSDDALKVLAAIGKNLIEKLTEEGCGSEEAKLLSLLVMYELRLHIDSPTCWTDDSGDGIRGETLRETLFLITKVNDLANPKNGISYVFTPHEPRRENITNKNFQVLLRKKHSVTSGETQNYMYRRDQLGSGFGHILAVVLAHEEGAETNVTFDWIWMIHRLRRSTRYPKGRPLLIITLADGEGAVSSNSPIPNRLYGMIHSVIRHYANREAVAFQFACIGDNYKALCGPRAVSRMRKKHVCCMSENDRLEDLKNPSRKWELVRKLLLGPLIRSNHFLNYQLETEFNPTESCVIHTTYLPSRNSPGPGGTIVKTLWTDVEKLGNGAFGTVMLQKSGGSQPQFRAVKHIHKYDDRLREIKAICQVRDRGDLFVEFLGWYSDKDLNGIYIAMEYIKNGDLSWWLQDGKTIDEETTREITIQVLKGLRVLHRRGICHRDLKPQNILVASLEPQLRVKIADFGASKHTENTELRTRIGTSGYLAPEILGLWNSDKNPGSFTFAIDIWSLGCLIYQMLSSFGPFTSDKTPPTTSKTVSGLPEEEYGASNMEPDMALLFRFCNEGAPLPVERLDRCKVSETGKRFIQDILQADPSSRPVAGLCLELINRWAPSGDVGSYEIVACPDVDMDSVEDEDL